MDGAQALPCGNNMMPGVSRGAGDLSWALLLEPCHLGWALLLQPSQLGLGPCYWGAPVGATGGRQLGLGPCCCCRAQCHVCDLEGEGGHGGGGGRCDCGSVPTGDVGVGQTP